MEKRTPEELKNPEYNYFIALKLDVTETNGSNIDKAINRTLGNTGGSIVLRRLLNLREDIETTLQDASLRKEEAKAASRFKLDEIMPVVIGTAVSNGIMYKSDLEDLCNTANRSCKFFEFTELEKRFLDATKNGSVKYIDNTTKLIPFAKFDKVAALLDGPNPKNSLYDYLEVPQTANAQEIEAAMKQKFAEAQKKSDLKIKQAVSNIGGEVKNILQKDPETRKQYDYYIKVKDKVWNMFKLRKTYGAKDMSLDMYFDFAKVLMDELKLDIDTVEKMLGEGLKYYGLIVSGGSEDAKDKLGLKDLEVCPYPDCGKIYENGAKICPHCGKPLEILCWNCGGKMAFTTKSKTCGACGASYQSKDRFLNNSAQIDKLLLVPECDITALEMAVSGLKNIVVNYKNFTSSVIYKKIAEYESEISKKKQIEESTGKQYQAAIEGVKKLIVEKNILQAKNSAENVKRKFSAYKAENTAKLIADIDNTLRRAQTELQSARSYIAAQNEESAISAVLRSLDICADFNEAKQFIAKYPPKPPMNVKAVSIGDSVKLSWQLSLSKSNTTYSVVRKVGTPIASVDDGSIIASNLTIDFYEDKSVAAATRFYYGIFAERGGVKSSLAVCSTPVQIFKDVTNIRQEMVENKISVKWDAPENVKRIKVWKKKGSLSPQSEGDGEEISSVETGGFTDAATGENSYLIICYYEIDGTPFKSKGVNRLFKNYEILKPLEGLKISRLTLTEFLFQAIAKSGKLKLVFTPQKLGCRTDALLQSASYAETVKGSREVSINHIGGEMTFTLPKDIVGWIYPIVYNDQLFMVSPPTEVNTVAGIRNISYIDLGTSGSITGTLNEKVINVIAKISEKEFISDFNAPADTIKLSAAEFKAGGGFKLNLKRNTNYYITVFAEVEVAGRAVLTYGEKLDEVICQRDKTVVKYCLEYVSTPLKPFKLTVKFIADSQVAVPELLIMRGSPKPMDKSRGELIEKVPATELKKGLFGKEYTFKMTLTVPPMARDMKFSLFPADDNTGYVQLKEVIHI